MKAGSQKPRICIALPGTDYVPHAPLLFANTLPMLPYLEEEFDVTVLFRKVLGKPQLDYKYSTILDLSTLPNSEKTQSNANFSPTGFFSARRYLNTLNAFSKTHAKEFDLIIERQWSLVGALSSAFKRHGVPSIFVVEAEFYTTKDVRIEHPVKRLSTALFKKWLPWLRRQWIQKADGIIVETEQMKSFLIEKHYARPNKPVYPIPNGIDPGIFFPRDRRTCREKLGIDQDSIVLTYVGSLNRFIQEPGPIIEALGREQPHNVVFQVIGDGMKRKELEQIATKFNAPVVFRGRLPQQEAALYIGAANLCIAPYNKSLFPEEKFTSASLKVCEYLACGRPVVTIPCGRMEHLLNRSQYGFLVQNDVASYQTFFRDFPDIDKITTLEDSLITGLENSTLKAQRIVMSWQDIAEIYTQVIKENLTQQ